MTTDPNVLTFLPCLFSCSLKFHESIFDYKFIFDPGKNIVRNIMWIRVQSFFTALQGEMSVQHLL